MFKGEKTLKQFRTIYMYSINMLLKLESIYKVRYNLAKSSSFSVKNYACMYTYYSSEASIWFII